MARIGHAPPRGKMPPRPPLLKAPPMGMGAGPMGGPMGAPTAGLGGPSAAGMPPRGYAKGTGMKLQRDPDARDDRKEKAAGKRDAKDSDAKADLKGYAKGSGITVDQATGGITKKVPNSGGITKGVPPASGITKGQTSVGITKSDGPQFKNKQRAPMGSARPGAPRNAGPGRTAKGR